MLNFVNRVIVSLWLLVLILLLLATAVTPQGTATFLAGELDQVQVDPISVQHLIVAAACLVLAVLSTLLLSLQWRRRRPPAIPLLSGSNSATIAAESVVARLRADVEILEEVRQALPVVRGRGKVVDVQMDVRTDPAVNVPAKSAEIEQVVRDSMERLGLKLGRLRVKIAVAKGAVGRGPNPEPAGPSLPPGG
jgi:hypothetical protein